MKRNIGKYIVLVGISVLSVSCLGGCTGKKNATEGTAIQKEQAAEENTFQGLEDNMVFDVLWEDQSESWFA